MQQLRRYWRLFLPAPFGPRSLNGWSKLLEFQRSAAPLAKLGGTAAGLAGGLAAMLLTARGALPPLELPDAAWAALLLGAAAGFVTTWQRYRLSGTSRIGDMLGGELARMSLTWVAMVAGVAGLSSRPLGWRRTPKFATKGSIAHALASTSAEAAIALVHGVVLVLLLGAATQIGAHLSLLGALGVALSGLRFAAAPAMALLGERSLALAGRREAAEALVGDASECSAIGAPVKAAA